MDQTKLLELIDGFDGASIVVVGDLIVDHYIWGNVDRISPEAPVVVVRVTEENRRPGGAGNVARNLASLGLNVGVCGIIGDDQAGRDLVALLESDNINTDGILVDRTRMTTVKTRVIAHAQQVVRVDHENSNPLAATYSEGLAAALESRLRNTQGVIISDYAKGAIGTHIFDRIEAGYQQGLLGFGKIPVLVDPKDPHFDLYSRATVIKPNRQEAEAASGVAISDRSSAVVAANKLHSRWNCELVLVTLGEDGMVLVPADAKDGQSIEIDTVAEEVYDVSGAGDTVSAVFGAGLSVGASPYEAAVLANFAAGIVVKEIGTVAITKDQLYSVVSASG